MGSAILFTAARMQEIEDGTVTSGLVDGNGHLILKHHDDSTVDAGKVTADNLADASDTVKGIVRLATDAETIAGIDDLTTVTPQDLAVLTATDTRRGLVELATPAEVLAGVDNTLAVTPAGLEPRIETAFLAARNRNRIINGNYRTNQRGYVSGRGVQGYCFDGWRATDLPLNNLARDPCGAISGFLGWVSAGGTLSQLTGQTIPGTSITTAVRSTFTGAGSGLYHDSDAREPFWRVKAGATYTVSAYVRSSVAKTVYIAVQWMSSSFVNLGTTTSSNVALAANTWTRISFTTTPLAGAWSGGPYSYAPSGFVAGDTYDVTGLLIEETPTLHAYHDPPAMTFAPTAQGQMVTLNAPFQSPIERSNIEAGDYVLAWKGTSQARVYNAGATAPYYAASPVLVTLDGSDDVIVEFNAGTVGEVQFERGSTPTPFERIPVSDELAQCQYYYQRIVSTISGESLGVGQMVVGNYAYINVPIKRAMRPMSGTGPRVQVIGSPLVYRPGLVSGTAASWSIVMASTTGSIVVQALTTSSTNGVMAIMQSNAAGQGVELSAEL